MTSSAKKPRRPDFHPIEFAFCGYSNSGKTTLISKVLDKLSKQYCIGYIKHDAHRFAMDHPGKDTATAWDHGAQLVMINDRDHAAVIRKSSDDRFSARSQLIDCDLVLVEGYKQSQIEKFIVVDDQEEILEKIRDGSISNVMALIGSSEKAGDGCKNLDLPYFCRDHIQEICNFIESKISDIFSRRPIYGLVLTGGKSQRMKQDKALIQYAGKSHALRCFELLQDYCDQAYLSSRQNQWEETDLRSLPTIEDQFLDMGPTGGILSAMRSQPDAAWLVVACDLPLLNEALLEHLLESRKPEKVATCYASSQSHGFPEPLCTVYEPKAYTKLLQAVSLGYECPRKMLINSPIEILDQPDGNLLMNANTPEEYRLAAKKIRTTAIGFEANTEERA